MALLEAADQELLMQFALALGLGGLIGLERERHGDPKAVAGVRTMPLIALAGLLAVHVGNHFGSAWPVVAGLAAVGALAFAYAWPAGPVRLGFTSATAVLAVYLIGVLVGLGLLLAAAVAGVVITILLAMRDRLHRFAHLLTEHEVNSALQFLVIVAVVLPFAPDEPVDPWGLFDPQEVLRIVVLVSVLSFASFLVMRRFGPGRGLPVSGFLGGLVSSAAAVGSLAGIGTQDPRFRGAAVRGMLLAVLASFVRNLALAIVVAPATLFAVHLAPPLALMALPLLVAAYLIGRQDGDGERAEPPSADLGPIRSPFAVAPALRFGLVFLVVSAAATLLPRIPGLGATGVYLAAVGGLVSTGAVIASMALLLTQGQVSAELAASVALVAMVLALGVKAAIARTGGSALFARMRAPTFLAALVGIAGAVGVRLL